MTLILLKNYLDGLDSRLLSRFSQCKNVFFMCSLIDIKNEFMLACKSLMQSSSAIIYKGCQKINYNVMLNASFDYKKKNHSSHSTENLTYYRKVTAFCLSNISQPIYLVFQPNVQMCMQQFFFHQKTSQKISDNNH